MLVEVIAELQDMIKTQDSNLNEQAERMHSLEVTILKLQAVNDLRAVEDRHTNAKLAEHQIAIAEMRCQLNGEKAKLIELPNVLQKGLS